MSPDPSSSPNWSRANIAAHWIVFALVIVQLLDKEGMENWFDASRGEGAASSGDTLLAVLHVVAGVSILGFTLFRLWDRYAHGRPAYPPGHPRWAILLSKLNHALLFAVLIVMPLLGAAALFGGSEEAGRLHGSLMTVLFALVGLHVAGALVEHFWFRNDLLLRMLGRGGRDG